MTAIENVLPGNLFRDKEGSVFLVASRGGDLPNRYIQMVRFGIEKCCHEVSSRYWDMGVYEEIEDLGAINLEDVPVK
jgi:hypothetical protein